MSTQPPSYTSTNPPTTDPNSATTTSKQSIPSHPAPVDAAAVSSGVPTDATATATSQEESGPAGRKESSAEKHAEEHTQAWKPNLDRRQSWSKEDQKRALQMSGIKDE